MKTETRHTPGPWRIVRDAEERYEIMAPSGVTIAQCALPWTEDSNRILADAHLIAAAPALLAALRDILGGQLTGAVDTNAERFQRARAAVALATGTE